MVNNLSDKPRNDKLEKGKTYILKELIIKKTRFGFFCRFELSNKAGLFIDDSIFATGTSMQEAFDKAYAKAISLGIKIEFPKETIH